MITPIDIENVKFKKQLMGYNTVEVEELLSQVLTDFEHLYRENAELKDKMNVLTDAISHYKAMEETLKNTLLVAQNTGEEVKRVASERGENIVRESEIRAEQIIQEAYQKIALMEEKYMQTKQQFGMFKSKVESLMQEQAKWLQEIS